MVFFLLFNFISGTPRTLINTCWLPKQVFRETRWGSTPFEFIIMSIVLQLYMLDFICVFDMLFCWLLSGSNQCAKYRQIFAISKSKS